MRFHIKRFKKADPSKFSFLADHLLYSQTDQPMREQSRVLVAGGEVTRNMDYWSGKHYRINPMGIRTGTWANQGGIILYMHNHHIPMGKGSVYKEEGKLWSPDNFDFHREILPVATQNWIGDAIGDVNTAVLADMWEKHYLNAVSIGLMFTPADFEMIEESDDEIYFGSSEMLEFSIVTLAADRDAHRQSDALKRYHFMLEQGVRPEAAMCLNCHPNDLGFSVTKSEVTMEFEEETEVIEEDEDGLEEEFAQEDAGMEVVINPAELVQAVAQDSLFMSALAQEIVSSPEFAAAIETAVTNRAQQLQQAQPPRPQLRLRFESTEPQRQQAPSKVANGVKKTPVQKKPAAPNAMRQNSALRLMKGGA